MSPFKGRNVRVRGGWWHYQFEARGRLHSGNTGLAGTEENRTAAEEFAERERQAVAGPTVLEDRSRKPFDEAAGEFCAWAKDVEYRSKPNTSARLKTSLNSAVEFWTDRPVSEVGVEEVEQYKAWRFEEHQVRDITVRHDLHALSVFFRYAIKMRWAARNPLAVSPVTGERDIKIPSDRDAVREHVITREEEGAYLRAALGLFSEWAKGREGAQPNMHDVALMILETGARPEELMAARKENFDARAGTLQITGGKTRAARRLLNLTARAASVAERRMASEGPWLFPSDRRPGHHITKLQSTHDRICLEAGVSFVIYDCRHTWATRMITEAKVDAATVAALMGHSGLRTIFRYVHPTAEAKKRAMERFEAAAKRKRLKVVNL